MPVSQHNKEKVLSCLLVRRGRTSAQVQEASGLSGATVNRALLELKSERRVVELTGKKRRCRWRKVTPRRPKGKRAPPIRPASKQNGQLELNPPRDGPPARRFQNALSILRKVESLPEEDRLYAVRMLAGVYLGHGQD